MNTVSLKEAQQKIRNKGHAYDALEALGYCLPRKDHKINTADFYRDIRNEKCFCPKMVDIRINKCKRPPTLQDL